MIYVVGAIYCALGGALLGEIARRLTAKRRFNAEVDRMIAEQVREFATHPNCRCSTFAVSTSDMLEKRAVQRALTRNDPFDPNSPESPTFIVPGIAGEIATVEEEKGRFLNRSDYRGPDGRE